MAVTVQPITPDFAAEVGDVTLGGPHREQTTSPRSAPPSPNTRCWFFPDQEFDDETQLDFARHFGPARVHRLQGAQGPQAPPAREHWPTSAISTPKTASCRPTIASGSTILATGCGTPIVHSNTYRPLLDASCTLHRTDWRPHRIRRHARRLRCPARGHQAAREGLVAEHSIMTSRAELGFTNFKDASASFRPVPQVMVRRLDSGRHEALYREAPGTSAARMTRRRRCWSTSLPSHATQRQFVYTHRWRVKDLVIWDDRCTMHRGIDSTTCATTRHAPRHGVGRGADLRANGARRRRRMTPEAFRKLALSLADANGRSAWRPSRLLRRRQGLRLAGLSRARNGAW